MGFRRSSVRIAPPRPSPEYAIGPRYAAGGRLIPGLTTGRATRLPECAVLHDHLHGRPVDPSPRVCRERQAPHQRQAAILTPGPRLRTRRSALFGGWDAHRANGGCWLYSARIDPLGVPRLRSGLSAPRAPFASYASGKLWTRRASTARAVGGPSTRSRVTPSLPRLRLSLFPDLRMVVSLAGTIQ